MIVDEVERENNEECRNAIEDRITYTESSTHFQKSLMYLLKQHDTTPVAKQY